MFRRSGRLLRAMPSHGASVSIAALLCFGASAAPQQSRAQGETAAPASVTPLPTVSVDISKPKRRPKHAARTGPRLAAPAPRLPAPPAPAAPPDTQDARTGTVGVYANSTSVATKTNTAIVNIPQSVDVLTRTFINDQGSQSIDEAVRYVPGVILHQGEGNRDELVIRGVDSSANFFVNGFRDDVQYFRDLYNAQSVEILKGPSALIFGRGAGGGILNRTLKEADWSTWRQATATTGSWWDRRVAVDVGQGLNPNLAARLNAFYEQSDAFRDHGHFERYGFNPTMTLKPTDDTKVRLSYEYYHDERLADRGNPSQGLSAVPPASTRFNPAAPFVSDWSTLFGSPIYNGTRADVQTVMGFVEHDFGNGLSVKNGTFYASYLRGYRNVFPGNGPLSGAVDPAQTAVNLAAYENTTNRSNAFNQTDFTYKTFTGPVKHTITFGTEFGLQAGLSERNTGFFPANGNANTIVVNPFAPTYFGPVVFNHIATDASSRYELGIQSGYVQDQIELSRYLHLIAGVRYDRFDLSALDQNTNARRNRVDEEVSPRAAVIVKPMENLSLYGSYSVSFLPASGDQFSTLTAGTVLLEPQQFENREVGMKWNIFPTLLFSAAAYQLIRSNVPIADPSRPGFFFPSGSHRIQGFETALRGYVTDAWQTWFGYAYTDARITSATSPTIVPGNVVQLVPFHQFSWWNKYQFTPIWAAALGVVYFSDSFASSDDSVRLPGYVRFDAAVYAKVNETWNLQLNVENVFDTGYWATADGNNNISPGRPRTVRLIARASL